jgi:hypothetical protein
MAAYIYIYADGDFKPDNVAMYGYVFKRETPTSVDDETAEKLNRHPHFKCLVGNSSSKPSVAHTDAAAELPAESSKELTSKEKKAAYMREYMHRKRSGA